MFRVKGECPICGTGSIGFRVCSGESTLVLMCDECDSLWTDPRSTHASKALYAEAPDFLVPGLSCSIGAPASRWASREEVEGVGWGALIQGEGTALGGG